MPVPVQLLKETHLRRMIVAALATAGLLTCTSAAMADPPLDLENLSGAQAEQMIDGAETPETTVQERGACRGHAPAGARSTQ